MAELYFFVLKERIEDVIDCGLKLSEWYDRELDIPEISKNKKVLKAFLNPRDNKDVLNDSQYQCIRLEVELDYCRIADSFLYNMGLINSMFMEYYYNTIIPLKDYCFGTYRDPEVLITASVLPENIKLTGKVMDIPLIYENSEEIYLANRIEWHEEEYKDSGNHLLYTFYKYLESVGKVNCYEDQKQRNCIFYNNDGKEYIVLRIP